jgi:glucose/arabinose dehydrogenase
MSQHRMIGGFIGMWRFRLAGLFAVSIAALAWASPSASAADAGTVLIGTFDQPLYIASAPGQPRLLFIVEQGGHIQILDNEVELDHPFLDVSGIISTGSERGLLSVAFPPDYATSGRFYVAFTNTDGDVELDEFMRMAGDATRADPATRRIVLTVPHPGAANHNGGQLQFGPDGFLYMSVGDGGNLSPPGEPARRLDDLRGKILRIKPLPRGADPYSIPHSNPFVGRPGARGEIFAYGLRNPWRFTFDGGRIVIADVGQSSREEVDFLRKKTAAGVNFGWPQYEGDIVFDNTRPGPDPAVFPMLVYPHSGGRCAIIGGYVVHDPHLPKLLGRYLYGDLCTGEVRSFIAHVEAQKALHDRPTGVTLTWLSGFGLGSQGQIYLAEITGNVSRLIPPP